MSLHQLHREAGWANPGRYSLYRKQAVWVEAKVEIFQTLPTSRRRPEEDFAIPLSLTQGDGFEISPWVLAIVGFSWQHTGLALFPTGKHYLLLTLYYKKTSAVFCCKDYFLLHQRNVKHRSAESQSDSGALCWSIYRQRRVWAQSVCIPILRSRSDLHSLPENHKVAVKWYGKSQGGMTPLIPAFSFSLINIATIFLVSGVAWPPSQLMCSPITYTSIYSLTCSLICCAKWWGKGELFVFILACVGS